MKSVRVLCGNKICKIDRTIDFKYLKEINNFKYLNDKKDCLLYYQGNLFNYNALKQKLVDKSFVFSDNSDEELLIKLYQEFGIDFIEYIDGEFAFCIYDYNKKNTIIYRSLMFPGQLYYSMLNNKLIVSTSLKNILENRKNKINNNALELYMNLRFIPSPYTIIENVFKLENGYLLTFNGEEIEKKQIARIDIHNLENNDIKKVGLHIVDAVKRSDNNFNNYGIFLSGGFDSAIIASILSNNHEKIKAFSVGYEAETKYDETEIAKNIANDLNLEHKIYKIQNSELLNLLNESVEILEEPFYSTVAVSTLKLAKESSRHVNYIYSGDGSDELFYGYKYLRDALINENTLDYYLAGLSWLKEFESKDFFISSKLTKENINEIMFKEYDCNNNTELLRHVEIFNRFPEYHLFRVGKILNEFNLKSILPFTSRDLIKFALGINGESIINDSDPKIHLKNSLTKYLTKDMIEAKKQPFTAPNKEWIEDPLKEDIKRLFNNNELFNILNLNQDLCLQILQNYKGSYKDMSNIWGIYVLLKWCERFKKYITNEVDYEKK